jgi:hypothetical protein
MRLKRVLMFADDAGNTLIFRPVKHVPGFTHRVIINSEAADWLGGGFPPSARHASYFLKKHQHLLKKG